MNLDDLLSGYKVNPKDEIRKINNILSRKTYVFSGYESLANMFRIQFLSSEYSAYESSFDDFYNNIILNNELNDFSSELESTLFQYRMYSELLLNLLNVSDSDVNDYKQSFSRDIKQLIDLISNGLFLSGFKVVKKKGKIYTEKIDIVSEAVSVIDKTYQEDIFDYLKAKSIKEKDAALTNLSIKLEAMEPNNNYVKQNKKYVQLMRHREEKKYEAISSWFFDEANYKENLDKLFKIFIFMIAYNNCSNYIAEFDDKTGVRPK